MATSGRTPKSVRVALSEWRDDMADNQHNADYGWTVLARGLAVARNGQANDR
jgi:hypothetical protein